ncbi:PREDICTED: frizzled-9-like [Ceratosolen solmsi marchali]|uniref:Frizzled-9-like n=1 Tax=Ceratosolen solmsi marchali TaxID=326594 RepID=A0AAJ7E1D2_9HYME|nr:PREDICTED: frizzled-9-like [Ceratosolen solmsi marchali]
MTAYNVGVLLALAALAGVAVSWGVGHQGASAKCERLGVSFCRGLRYNLTAMPNFMGHEDQLQAERGLATLMPLVHYNCSRHLRFFLCSVFAPVCSEHVAMQIPACKPLCLSVKRDCAHTLKDLTLPWPHMLDCDRFPDSGNTLCVQPPPEENLSSEASSASTSVSSHSSQQQQEQQLQEHEQLKEREQELQHEHEQQQWPLVQPMQPIPLPPRANLHQKCPAHFVETPYVDVVSSSHYPFHAFMIVTSCVPRCGADAYYRTEDKRFAERWMSGWAWLCFLSTLFTLLTFWVEPARFRYPERPIVFIALCYNLMSLGYIIRGALGPENLSCVGQDDGPSYVPVNDGLRSVPCTIWWLGRYYLGLASSLWWTILCGCWLLSARNEWSSEALHNIAAYLHVAAWGLPTLLTGGTLISRNVSADELTGLCQVSDESALWLEVLPNTCLLLLGCFLGGIAGLALVRVRRVVRSAGRSATKLERLMTRLGVFALLYALPALGSLACALQESQARPRWRTLALLAALDCRSSQSCVPGPRERPIGLEFALLRLFLSLVIGVTSGMWVWSGKTCRAWSRLLAAPSKPQRPAQQAVHQGYRREAVNAA